MTLWLRDRLARGFRAGLRDGRRDAGAAWVGCGLGVLAGLAISAELALT